MCGIAGYAGTSPPEQAVVERMCDALRHRGPDGEGYHRDRFAVLGMRRLAIIDVAGGDQPIYNEDGTVAVVFNGEIYNFRELRARLEAAGHQFRTGADTECIVHLYEEHGADCARHLRGMFAFAVWDAKARRLLLARDRVGKKPLYYRETPDGIWFASEMKALLQDPSFQRRVDPVAIHHYLTYQYVPAPFAAIEGVRKLLPAHTLELDVGRGASRTKRYWRLSYASVVPPSEAEATEQLRALLHDAVRTRLVSERPIGALLSGGLDSSLVVAAMAELGSAPVRTFSIGFEDEAYDERPYARMVAKRFGTDHHELVVTPSAIDILPELTWHYDEPFADSSAIPSMYVARLARGEVTVVLNGDGGDESFGGYERYVANLLAARVRIPGPLHRVAPKLVRLLPGGHDLRSFANRAKRFLVAALGPPEERYVRWLCHFDNESKRILYTPWMQEVTGAVNSYDLITQAFAEADGEDLVDRTLAVDVATYLPNDLLVKMDIATMAFGLEARSPLLDHQLMEYAASLPSRLKIHRSGRRYTGKYLLKRVARGVLPDEVIDRPKRGFGVPMAAWLRGELRDLSHDMLTDAVARGRGYFRPESIARLLAQHDAGIDHAARIWNLLQLELWHRRFIDASSDGRSTSRG